MSVTSIVQSNCSTFMQRVKEETKFSTLIPRVAVNLNKVAVPVIMLFAFSNVEGALAGGVAYGICISACMALATPVFMPACIAGCMAAAVIPSP